MNILVAKLGLKQYFNPLKWNYNGGGFEWINTIIALAANNPEITFYHAQYSDSDTLTDEQKKILFPHNNMIFVREFANKTRYDDNSEESGVKFLSEMTNWFIDNKIILDGALLDTGPYFSTTQFNFIPSERGVGPYAKPSIMGTQNTGTVINTLNNVKVFNGKCSIFHPDPRNVYKFRDATFTINEPILSQYNFKCDQNYYDPVKKEFLTRVRNYEYNGCELGTLIGWEYDNNTEKTTEFGLICNQGDASRGAIDRTQIVKEYILSSDGNEEIYGKWDDDIVITDHRFKGVKNKAELDNFIKSWKYSLCIPIGIGWVTTKYLELIKSGVVPFLHPYYDQQRHTNIPDFLRIMTRNVMLKKIEFLEKNNNREKLIDKLVNFYSKDEYVLGHKLVSTIMKQITGNQDYTPNIEASKSIKNLWNRYHKTFKKEASIENFF